MVEIIQRGTPPSEFVYVCECRNCRSRMTFRKAEAVYHPGAQREGGYHALECPVCRETIAMYSLIRHEPSLEPSSWAPGSYR